MLFSHSSYERLEARRLLNADALAAAPSMNPPTMVSGLLRYESSGSLLLTESRTTTELQQHWPTAEMSLQWQPKVSGDFNGDGQMDVLGNAESETGRESWLQAGFGNEFFLLPWGDALPYGTELLGTGDVNGDGLLDVISWNPSTHEIWTSVNNLEFGFRNQLWTRWSEPVESRMFVGDFDQDGRADVLGSASRGRWLLAKSDGSRFLVEDWGPYGVFDWQDMVIGDFDGDSYFDVAARAPDRTWWVWRGSNHGLASADYWGHWKMGTNFSDVHAADFNNDGRDDIVGRSSEGSLLVATAAGDDSQPEFHSWQWVTGWVTGAEWHNVLITDVTQDGLLDQVGQARDGTWWVAENVGGNFRNFFLDRTNPGITVDYIVDADHRGISGTALNTSIFGHSPIKHVVESAASPRLPLRVELNSQGHLVLEGNGQKIRAIEFQSASGSLIPMQFFEPSGFDELTRNDRVNIRLSTSHSVTIDGKLTLGVRWDDAQQANDLKVLYDVLDVPATVDVASFNRTAANATKATPLEQYVEVYPNSVRSIEIPTADVDAGSPESVPIKPSAPSDREIGDTSSNKDFAPLAVELDDPQFEDEVSSNQDFLAEASPARLVLTEDNQFVLNVVETPIYALRIESSNESLIAGNSPHPFEELVVSDSGLVVYASTQPVLVESAHLDLFWDAAAVTDQVIAEVGLENSDWLPATLFEDGVGQTRPPKRKPVADAAIAEDSPAIVHLNGDSQFVVSADNFNVLGMNFVSPAGGLITGSSPHPFGLFVSNSPRQITLGTWGQLVTFGGEVTLDVGWNSDVDLEDLVIEFGDPQGKLLNTQRTNRSYHIRDRAA